MMAVRNFEELRAAGLMSWPDAIARREQDLSIVPRLIETQEKFISLLHVADAGPFAWKDALHATQDLPANLFLKHLLVLSDVSGEKLKNDSMRLAKAFHHNKLPFFWRGVRYEYDFQTLGQTNWNNATLLVDGKGLAQPHAMTPAMEDTAMLVLFGSCATTPSLPDWVAERCLLGAMLGQKAELSRFIRERYIWVSRITGGATANTLGQLVQHFVREQLHDLLPAWSFDRHTIPGISQNAGATDMSFDIVARSPRGAYCAIEVSFQVTTNSTVERKAGQAEARQRLLHRKRHRIAYVIDGSGNFYRKTAISTICRFSDCTVTCGSEELARLAKFLKDKVD